MIEAIRKFFEANMLPAASEHDEHGLRLACAALLYEVARMDFKVQGAELDAVARLVQEKFGLAPDVAGDLLAAAEQEVHNAVSYHEFTSLINQRFSYEQKTRLVEMMWHVAFADHHLDKYEEHLIRKVADLLYISHVDFIQAKHRAQAAD